MKRITKFFSNIAKSYCSHNSNRIHTEKVIHQNREYLIRRIEYRYDVVLTLAELDFEHVRFEKEGNPDYERLTEFQQSIFEFMPKEKLLLDNEKLTKYIDTLVHTK